MDWNHVPRDFVPRSYAEAILFAHHWYHDSGFNDYLEGFRHGASAGRLDYPAINLNTRVGLIAWARKQVNVSPR